MQPPPAEILGSVPAVLAWYRRQAELARESAVPGPSCPVRLWAEFRCGGCGSPFTADPSAVPMFATGTGGKWPCCLPCWDRRNRLRAALGYQAEGRPPAYPQDYPQGGVP